LSRNETWNLQPRLAWLFPEGVSAGPGTIGIEENEIFSISSDFYPIPLSAILHYPNHLLLILDK